MCAIVFAGLPVLFAALPVLVQTCAARSVGSVVAQTTMLASLSVGWGYRAFERFFLDGCAPMNAVARRMRRAAAADGGARASPLRGAALTTLAALVSPTAVLHGCTGVTLVVGYMHARTVEDAAGLLGDSCS